MDRDTSLFVVLQNVVVVTISLMVPRLFQYLLIKIWYPSYISALSFLWHNPSVLYVTLWLKRKRLSFISPCFLWIFKHEIGNKQEQYIWQYFVSLSISFPLFLRAFSGRHGMFISFSFSSFLVQVSVMLMFPCPFINNLHRAWCFRHPVRPCSR